MSESSIKIINQHDQHVDVLNENNNHACIQWHQEPSMCNQEIGTHWSTHQMSHFPHLKFKLDPLDDPKWSRHFVNPVFSLDAFPLDDKTRFLFIWWKIWFFLENTWSHNLFLFYFLREKQNKKEKTLNMTPEGKTGLRKIEYRSKGQVIYWEGTVKIVAPL